MRVANKWVARKEPGRGWYDPSDLVDQEVTDAFNSKHARLYEASNQDGTNQFVVIDGGKAA
jgi:hypothetical protein